MKSIEFNAIDTLFFKEARPMDGFGGSELKSLFPPPIRTIAGALRASYGDSRGVDWKEYRKNESYGEIKELIGDASGYGKLKFGGIFIHKNEKRLYPAPLHLVRRIKSVDVDKPIFEYETMKIGDAIECDLGKVRLPQLPNVPKEERRFSSLPEGAMIDEEELLRLLEGEVPTNIYLQKELFGEEPRVGIARDNRTRVVEESKLYQTRHIRPFENVKIVVDVQNLPTDFAASGFCKLGAEGRGAYYKVVGKETLAHPQKPKNKKLKGVVLMLLTPADLPPMWFTQIEKGNEGDRFVDELNGVRLGCVSACVGKSFKEGGFDLAGNKSREAKSYLPSGSVWFCEVLSDIEIEEAVKALHGLQIGGEWELGRGLIACGYWTE